MSEESFKVGGDAAHVALILGRPHRVVRQVTIVRETPTQWIDDMGTRWRKNDGSRVPQYAPEPRRLMPLDEARAALAQRGGS